MLKVVFVNEHRVVEVPPGKNLKTLLVELGIDTRAQTFNALTCGVLRACAGCQVWVRPEDAAAPALPLHWRERWAGMRGERRLACQVTVSSNIEVVTMAGGVDRLRAARPIAPPPQPTADPSARRKPIDAAPTAEFVLGHPTAVGSGTRSAPLRQAAGTAATTSATAATTSATVATTSATVATASATAATTSATAVAVDQEPAMAPSETERRAPPGDPSP